MIGERLGHELVSLIVGLLQNLQAIRQRTTDALQPHFTCPPLKTFQVRLQPRAVVDGLVRLGVDQLVCQGVYNTCAESLVAVDVTHLKSFAVKVDRVVLPLEPAELPPREVSFRTEDHLHIVQVVPVQSGGKVAVEGVLGCHLQDRVHDICATNGTFYKHLADTIGDVGVVLVVLDRLRSVEEQLHRVLVEEPLYTCCKLRGTDLANERLYGTRDRELFDLPDDLKCLRLRQCLATAHSSGHHYIGLRREAFDVDDASVRAGLAPDTELVQAAYEPGLLSLDAGDRCLARRGG